MSVLAVQLEQPGEGFLELSGEALAAHARSLAQAWRSLGVRPADRVVIYDYGSSPLVYLASRAFTPYLRHGAAELTGALVLCVDGLPDHVWRLAHVLRHFKPRFLFVRAELVWLLIGGPTAIPESQRTPRLVVACGEDAPAEGERASWQQRWPAGAHTLCRHTAPRREGWRVL